MTGDPRRSVSRLSSSVNRPVATADIEVERIPELLSEIERRMAVL